MISTHQYVKELTYKQCKLLNDISKVNNCTIKFNSSSNIINAINITSLLNLESGFYHITINGNNENDILKQLLEIIK